MTADTITGRYRRRLLDVLAEAGPVTKLQLAALLRGRGLAKSCVLCAGDARVPPNSAGHVMTGVASTDAGVGPTPPSAALCLVPAELLSGVTTAITLELSLNWK